MKNERIKALWLELIDATKSYKTGWTISTEDHRREKAAVRELEAMGTRLEFGVFGYITVD